MDTITIQYADDQELVAKCKAILQRFGHFILDPTPKWETPKQVAARFGLSSGCLCQRLKRLDCPKYPAHSAKDGERLGWLVVTDQLAEYLTNIKRRKR